MTYILLTPARNEQDHLLNAARSAINQSLRPELWLIVNDGSTDRTKNIIDKLCSDYPWIVCRSLPSSTGGLGKHYAEVVNYGFKELQLMAKEREISYEYIAKIDADVSFEKDCFNLLINELQKDPSLGIVSPGIINFVKNEDKQQKGELDIAFKDHPSDGVRVYRRKCFDEIGGMQIVRAPETVAETKAILRGWKLKRIDHIKAQLNRKTHFSTSIWSRWMMAGSESYYLGYHPTLVVGHFCYELLFGLPRYRCLAYLTGYLRSFLKRESRIEDEEVLLYFYYQRMKEVRPQITDLLKRGFRISR